MPDLTPPVALALVLAVAACEPLPANRTGEVPTIKWLREWIGPAADPVGGGSGTRGELVILDRDGRVVGRIRPLR